MQTLKFKIKHGFEDDILNYQREYSSVLHVCFEHLLNDFKNDQLGTMFDYKVLASPLMQKIKSMNNVDIIQVWFKQNALSEAYQMIQTFKLKQVEYSKKMQRKSELEQKDRLLKVEKKELKHLQKLKEPKVIFGGRTLFNQRCKNQISKDEFKQKRLSPIYSMGTAMAFGNKCFRISEDLKHVVFQPDRKHHYELELIGVFKGYEKILGKLYAKQEMKDLPITYKLTSECVYISFEEDKLYKDEFNFKKIKDRYCALDLNPNYIGYSIVDWKTSNEWKVIESGVYSFKQINNKYNKIKGTDSTNKKKIYLNNKRNYEVVEVAKNLIEKCCYFKVENFIIEDLDFDQSKSLGTNLNRLCKNQWIRNRFINNLKKRCSIFGINFMEVLPQYSSFVGNMIFRKLNLPDQVLSSIEIGRRGYEFRHQYVLKDKEVKKNIVKIDLNDLVFKDLFRESLEEFSVEESFKDVINVYWHFKRNPRLCYRVSLDNYASSFRYFLSKHSSVDRFLSIL